MEGTPRPLGRGGGDRRSRALRARFAPRFAHRGPFPWGPCPRRRLPLGLAAVLAFALLFAQAPLPASADHDVNHVLQKIQELERAIQLSRQNAARYRQASAQYQSAVAAANAKIATLVQRAETAQDEAEQVSAEIEIAEEQLSIVTLQLNETIAYVASLQAAIDEGKVLLARRKELYAQHLRQMYRQARTSPLEMLLASTSLADFAQRVKLMALIARQDQELGGEIKRIKAGNEEKQLTSQLKRQEIEGLKAQVESQRAKLLERKARLDQLIAATNAARASTEWQRAVAQQNAQGAQGAAGVAQRQAADLERQKLAAEALYAQLAAQLQGSSGLTQPWRGKLAAWPLGGTITSYFGPRFGGFHNGIDIAAPMYTAIRAAHSGVVQVAGKPYLAFGDTAEVVIIAHASNFSTLYGHMDDRVRRLTVRPGQRVVAGQVIGYVGMTGWTTGPHLHFMTVLSGQPVNPLTYLP